MPHTGYDDQNVDVVYTQLEDIISQAQQKHFRFILTGDFNADVCIQCDDDIFESNDRGIWLRQFCSLHSLDISNESSMASAPQRWTFKRRNCRKQLDYFLLDNEIVKNVCSCIAVDYFDTGSDHRAVELSFKTCYKFGKKASHTKRGKSWSTSTDKIQYQTDLTAKSKSMGQDSLSTFDTPTVQFKKLEEKMVSAARGATTM